MTKDLDKISENLANIQPIDNVTIIVEGGDSENPFGDDIDSSDGGIDPSDLRAIGEAVSKLIEKDGGDVNLVINDSPLDSGDEGDACPFVDSMMEVMLSDRPFNINWDMDKIEDFLKKRGYSVISNKPKRGRSFKVAYNEDKGISEKDAKELLVGNLSSVFSNEIQDILLKWLLKIGK